VQAIDREPPSHHEYWKALTTLMQDQIDQEQAAQRAEASTVVAPKPALAAVEEIVAEALLGSHDELLELDSQVTAELSSPECTDPEFWAAIRPRYDFMRSVLRWCKTVPRGDTD
jgi:hypothetical protein